MKGIDLPCAIWFCVSNCLRSNPSELDDLWCWVILMKRKLRQTFLIILSQFFKIIKSLFFSNLMTNSRIRRIITRSKIQYLIRKTPDITWLTVPGHAPAAVCSRPPTPQLPHYLFLFWLISPEGFQFLSQEIWPSLQHGCSTFVWHQPLPTEHARICMYIPINILTP